MRRWYGWPIWFAVLKIRLSQIAFIANVWDLSGTKGLLNLFHRATDMVTGAGGTKGASILEL